MASIGYAGTIGPGGWVDMQRTIGCRYAVVHPSHLRLGVTSTGITLSAGSAGGGGVYDSWDIQQAVALTKPSSGTSWWLIVIRRDWTALTSTLVAIPAGTATPASLPTRNTTMGGIDDQPLWLVPWTSTQATPALASAVDLRLIGRGPSNFTAFSERVKEYFAEPGATVRIGSVDWICAIGAGDVLGWAPANITAVSGTKTGFTTTSPAGTGWYRTVPGGLVEVHWVSSANTASATMVKPVKLPSGFRPATRTALAATSGNSVRLATAHVDPDGTVSIWNGSGGSSPLCFHGLYSPA